MAIKQGPLTFDELMLVWRSVTDRSYNQPLLEKDNSLIEIVEQMATQFERASVSIDRNTQAMFILPWSGQTNPPSAGAAKATVSLTATRTLLFEVPITFTKGEVIVEHRLDDYGIDGPVDVTTNRRYVVSQQVTFGPGEAGPLQLPVEAEREGPGYNEPTPGTLETILQPGSTFNNTGATVENGSGKTNRLVCTIFPDVPIPRHIGQYLIFTAGANVGQIRRVTGIENPDPAIPHGGVFNLAAEVILAVSNVVGTFSVDEEITQTTSGAVGEFVALSNGKMIVIKKSGTFDGANSIAGVFGATADVDALEQPADLVPEVGTASWTMMRWIEDLGVSVTNVDQPTGGLCGFLDELGAERNIPRQVGEGDSQYRKRVGVPADVVSPAAVERAGNTILEPFDESVCLREVGRPLFPGMFFDGAPNQEPFAYDLDFVEINVTSPTGYIPGERLLSTGTDGVITYGVAQFGYNLPGNPPVKVFEGVTRVRGPGFEVGQTLVGEVSKHSATILTVDGGLLPEHRFFTYLNLREFRAFFLVGVPRSVIDDFGIFYDDTSKGDNAYDATTIDNFYDGAAIGTNSIYSQIYNAIDKVRAGGVRFDLYIEEFGCI